MDSFQKAIWDNSKGFRKRSICSARLIRTSSVNVLLGILLYNVIKLLHKKQNKTAFNVKKENDDEE